MVCVIALTQYRVGEIFQVEISKWRGYTDKLMNAKAVALISLVWSVSARSYTSRSFDNPVGQPSGQRAAAESDRDGTACPLYGDLGSRFLRYDPGLARLAVGVVG